MDSALLRGRTMSLALKWTKVAQSHIHFNSSYSNWARHDPYKNNCCVKSLCVFHNYTDILHRNRTLYFTHLHELANFVTSQSICRSLYSQFRQDGFNRDGCRAFAAGIVHTRRFATRHNHNG